MTTMFSVVLATRDRPALFQEALESVLTQAGARFEVIVVNDGSSAACLEAYQPIWAAAHAVLGERFQVHSLVHRPRGHGQSYSLNFGVSQARGDYVCFLDDDDRWTDTQHLHRAGAAIGATASQGQGVDLYMANQSAWNSDGKLIGTLWLGGLDAQLRASGRVADTLGSYRIDVADLMAATGFCHVNCLVVRRSLFQQVGGMDEGIRWECDRDLFLKLIEAAGTMLHHPAVVSYHRVPDPAKTSNMTTALGMLEKRLLQTIVLDRALLRTRHPAIAAHARAHKGYALRKMALEFAAQHDWARASTYANQALGVWPGFKWALYCLWCLGRRLGARG